MSERTPHCKNFANKIIIIIRITACINETKTGSSARLMERKKQQKNVNESAKEREKENERKIERKRVGIQDEQ